MPNCRSLSPVRWSPSMNTINQAKWMAALVSVAMVVGCGKKDAEKKPAEVPPPTKPTPQPDKKPPPPPRAELPADPGDHSGKHVWSQSLGSMQRDEGRAIAVDKSGNIAVVGIFSGPIDFGSGTAVTPTTTDAFVAVFAADGKHKWSLGIGGEGSDIGSLVTFDNAGNVIVGGWYSKTMTVGETVLKSLGADDMFIAKFDPAGTLMWIKSIGAENIELVQSIAATKDNALIATGEFRAEVMFGATKLKSAGNADIFLLKLEATGEVAWAKRFGSTGQDYGRSVTVDSRGDIVLAAEFSGTVDFGGAKPITHVGNRDTILAKFDGDGNHVWSHAFGSSFNDLGVGVATDAADNVVIVGSFEDKILIAGNEYQSAGTADIYVAKFNPDGKHQWSKTFGADNKDRASSVAVDKFGNIIFAGWFWYDVDFGGGALSSPNRNMDGFLVKLAPTGAHLWSKNFGDKDHDRVFSVAVDDSAHVAITGRFRFAPDFGGGPLKALSKEGDKAPPTDIFVARFAP